MESLTQGHVCAMCLFSLSLPKARTGTGSKCEVERWNSFLTQAELFVFCNSFFSLVFLAVHQIALLKGENAFSVPEERRRTIQQLHFLQVFMHVIHE